MLFRIFFSVLIVSSHFFISACEQDSKLKVGAKTFTESEILAEIFAAMATERGIPVERKIPYGNSFSCQEGIKNGDLDIYPEYSGTGLSLLGLGRVEDEAQALKYLKKGFSPFGLEWLESLGFSDQYVLVVRPEWAEKHRIHKISELKKIQRPFGMGYPIEFEQRPIDGLQPLVRKYGLTLAGKHLKTDDKPQLYRSLIDGEVQVVVGYSTDPQIEDFRLHILEDDKKFFQIYKAMPLVRSDALKRYPKLKEQLEKLSGILNEKLMRSLNKRVDLEGQRAEVVAREFLTQNKLIKGSINKRKKRMIHIAVTRGERDSPLVRRALRSIRRTKQVNSIKTIELDNVSKAIEQGKAILGVMGAEDFFKIIPNRLPERTKAVEAVAVLGHHTIHLLGLAPRWGASTKSLNDIKRLGVGPLGSSSEHVARILLDAYGKKTAIELVHAQIEEHLKILEKMADRKRVEKPLDAVLAIAPMGSIKMTRALRSGKLTLLSLRNWMADDRPYRYPFLRPQKILSSTYTGLKEDVDSLYSQVVLAGPAPRDGETGERGPFSTVQTESGRIVPKAMKIALSNSMRIEEGIDPTLPGSMVGLMSDRKERQPINPAPEVSLLSALVLLGIGYLIYALFREDKEAV